VRNALVDAGCVQGEAMIATSADVAKLAGVSRATVSQVLNGRGERFASETRARVRQAASDLGYQPSAAGRTLARGSSDFVIALIPNTTFGGNLQDLFERMTSELAARGLTLVLRLSTTTTESLDRLVTGVKPAAVFSITPFTDEQRTLLAEREVRAFDPSTATQIDHNAAIGAMQAEYLIGRGYRRIAFAHLQDARQDPFGHAREAGVRDACRAAGLPDPQVVRLDIDIDAALAALDDLRPPGIAVACYNDDVATALLSAARLRDLRVPDDVALIGMDRTPLSRVTLPPLTTIAYDLRAAASTAIYSILTAVDAPSLASEPPQRAALELIPGGTA
jgi:DNA-binding LacI/PurR family transcriptional regulator